MANKYLRRCVRNSGFFFFPSTSVLETHRPAAAAADHHIAEHLVQTRQGLPHDHCIRDSPARSAVRSSINGPCPNLLQGRGRCPSAFSSSSASTAADQGNDEGDDICFRGDQNLIIRPARQLARSHSCSNLQGKLLPSFIKSFLHHRNSHNHLHSGGHSTSCNFEEQAAGCSCTEVSPPSLSEYTRSSSSPSLPIRRHLMKLPQKARSFPTSRSTAGRSKSSSRGKRAPKGHVAVYVEGGRERRVVPIAYLSHPQFEALLERAHNEFGFRQKGGLLIPCSLPELQHTLRRIHIDNIPS